MHLLNRILCHETTTPRHIRERFLWTPFTVLLSEIIINSRAPSDTPGLNSAVWLGWFGRKLTVVCGDHEGVGGRVSRRSAVFEGAVRLALLKLPVQTKQVHSWRRGGGKQDEGRRAAGLIKWAKWKQDWNKAEITKRAHRNSSGGGWMIIRGVYVVVCAQHTEQQRVCSGNHGEHTSCLNRSHFC